MQCPLQYTVLEKLLGGSGTLNHPMNFLEVLSSSDPDPGVLHTALDDLYAPQTLRGITEGKSSRNTT